MTTQAVNDARRYASYLGGVARNLYGTPAYKPAKLQWLEAVDDLSRQEKQQNEIREKTRVERESKGWKGN